MASNTSVVKIAEQLRHPERLLRLDEVMILTSLGETSIHDLRVAGQFPQPVKLTRRTVAWRYRDVLAWLERLKPAQHKTQTAPEVQQAARL